MEKIGTSHPLAHQGTAKIHRLPGELINQIAAGEVVERPASLIKELVENSLDAGATRIEVHLIEGGLKEITIIDNGLGILEEDLELAVERHTTSKLTNLKDLESISTFGFRGEALSSIASVSDFSIRSRPQTQERGVSLHVPYGEKRELKPVGCPPGTQITVKDLFARIPARFKFLRAQATELSHCHRVFKELALGNPGVSFFLHHNNRLLAKYTAVDRLGRLNETLKPNWEPLHFQDEIEEMKFEAYLSPLDWTQERGEILLFINQRPVKNRLLLSSIKNSFVEIAGPHHEPSGVFYLDIRGDWVDVNVHPQKLEVRFYRQERIYSWLLSSLKKQLAHLKPLWNPSLPYPASPVMSSSQTLFPTQQLLNSSAVSWVKPLENHPSLWILETTQGLWIVNTKTLSQRHLYQTLKSIFPSQKISSKPLAIASILSLSAELLPQFQQRKSLIETLGFDVELFGDRDIAVKARPFFIQENNVEETLVKLLKKFSEFSSTLSPETLWDEGLKWLILQSPAPDMATPEQRTALLDPISEFNESWTCPLGNPVLFKLSWTQLEQHFKSL